MFQFTSNTEAKIALLAEKIQMNEHMMEKIDTAIEKMSDTNQIITKMLAVHDERIDNFSKLDENILRMIQESKDDAKSQHKDIEDRLSARLRTIETKVEDIVKFRWIVVGAALIISFSLSQSGVVVDLLTPDQQPARIEARN
tara:strand:- start:9 stop:434 length:426 start_codon:yes stop_codon:yes gene_type:complete